MTCEHVEDGLTGSAWGDWANYTASPLRAFESELGVQDPVGFWDPVGFTSDGDVATFKRRRSVELKHGRISMMATMGHQAALVQRARCQHVTQCVHVFRSRCGACVRLHHARGRWQAAATLFVLRRFCAAGAAARLACCMRVTGGLCAQASCNSF